MIIYLLRCLTVSMAVFVLAYVLLRLAVWCGWPTANRLMRRFSQTLSPNLLYALQVGPFIASGLIVLAFTVPSFLRFEPHAMEEEFGPPVVLLSIVFLGLLGAGLSRAGIAYFRTAKLVRQWRENATPISRQVECTGPETPPLVVAGVFRSRLLISSSTSNVLSEDELARAIAHESAHIENHDNLKKLMLRAFSFPRAAKLEREWLASVEIAADQYAVKSKRDAIDLASALVKASRLSSATAELATNLTSEAGTLLHLRVERLLAWDADSSKAGKIARFTAIAAGFTFITLTAFSYQTLLVKMHSLAELLMR